jgi:DNA excision repair protein ERCC-2
MTTFYLSVHDIVDVILRRGHLDTRVFNRASMQEGSRLHALYQGEQGSDYLSEYPLEYTFLSKDFAYVVNGKADGVMIAPNGAVTVEEIKTTVADLDEFIHDHAQWHLGQAIFYAYIIAKDRNLSSVTIVMTYLKQNNTHIRKQIRQVYTLEELEAFVNDVIARYTRYWEKVMAFKKERNLSVKDLPFPFKSLRPGQQEMMAFVNKAADEKKQVFIEAPTGIGKTVSVLYPLVKRFATKATDRIFYLTNKNSIKKVAMETLRIFSQDKAKIKAVEFTSKENICFNDKKGHCNPDECPFARNYYDKLLDAIFDALNRYDLFDRATIESLCFEKTMCPFEFQIDLSNYADVLVCDYTYVYDYHDRLGLEDDNQAHRHTELLVDECHNLPDRVRDMYSLTLDVHELEKALSLCSGREFVLLKAHILDLQKAIDAIEIPEDDPDVQHNRLHLLDVVPPAFEKAVTDGISDIKELLKKHTDLVTDPLLDYFYLLNSALYLCQLLDQPDTRPSFLFYVMVDSERKVEAVRIANLDSRPLIKEGSDLFESVIYFSATLSPKEYYIDLLGGDSKDLSNRLILSSPFPLANRKVFVSTSLSLYYRDRDNTLFEVFSLVKTACSMKKGNYFVFCPSFDYLDALANLFSQDPLDDCLLLTQGHSMSETGREEFLAHFQADNPQTTIGLMVLGGIFSEGIDLVGDRLIGSIVISVGLPQMNFERDRLMDYYDKTSTPEEKQKGFSYAYTYPGVNRVLQAAGRVIRTDQDVGFMLFIDSRFKYSLYRKVFQEIYPDATYLYSKGQLKLELRQFWGNKK